MVRPSTIHVLRRSTQVLVLASMLLVPALARYQNYLAAREVDRMIERWEGTLPGATLRGIDEVIRRLPGTERERAGRLQRDRTGALAYAQQLRGGPWSIEIGSISMTDPLAGAESIAASKRVRRVLLVGLLLPVVATVVLGRVFCAWICPMGFIFECTDKLRRVLRWLEIRPRNVRASRTLKYGLLAAGLLVAFVLSTAVLGHVYPPAMLGRELHALVFAIFDRAEIGRRGLWIGGLGWATAALALIVLVEVSVSRRWWCRYVCPGGALYSLLGAARPVRVTLRADACTQCARCVRACPMGLNPMLDQMGMECDSCGECLASCQDDALGYELRNPLAALGRPVIPREQA